MISFLARILDLISPRLCMVCGERLGIDEDLMCLRCHLNLPRTQYAASAQDNRMARLLWGIVPVERCAAWFYYKGGSGVTRMIVDMKYHDRPELGTMMGEMAAREMAEDGFFEDIDVMIPMPLSPQHQRRRGYNQSVWIAEGIQKVTGLPIEKKAVRRRNYEGSQANKRAYERITEEENTFEVLRPDRLTGRHVLIVDDVMTTSMTVRECALALCAIPDVRISVFCLGFAG